MKRKLITLAMLLVIILTPVVAMAAAAGSCTNNHKGTPQGGLQLVSWEWTSDAAGAVTEVGALSGITGEIWQVQFIPDSGGTQPTDAYDVTLLNAQGVDVLQGYGVDRSNDDAHATNLIFPMNDNGGSVWLWRAELTPAISNAGNAKGGTIYLFFKPTIR